MIKNILTTFISLVILSGCYDRLSQEKLNQLTAQELLIESKNLYEKEYYKDSIKCLEIFELHFSDHEEMPNAMYQRGLAYHSLKRYSRAAFIFEQFLKQYPSHPKSKEVQKYLNHCNNMKLENQLCAKSEEYDFISHKRKNKKRNTYCKNCYEFAAKT